MTYQIWEECLLESCLFPEMMGGRICYFVGKKCKWAVFTGQGWGQQKELSDWICTVLAAGLKKGKKSLKKRIAARGTYPSTFTAAKKVADFICLSIVSCRIGMFAFPLHKLLIVWTGGSQKIYIEKNPPETTTTTTTTTNKLFSLDR